VAGLGIRLYLDEMMPPDLAGALRRQGYDIESCDEAGRSNQGIPDAEQLTYAAQHGRAILTFNSVDYLRLDQAWKTAGRVHAGIVVSPQVEDFGTLLRCVQRHLDTYAVDVQNDLLLWLDTSQES
jgi:hypothetical protein